MDHFNYPILEGYFVQRWKKHYMICINNLHFCVYEDITNQSQDIKLLDLDKVLASFCPPFSRQARQIN